MTHGMKKVLWLSIVAGFLAVFAVVCFDPSAAAQSARGKENVATTQAEQDKSWEKMVQLFQKDSLAPTDIAFHSISGITADKLAVLRHGKPKEQQYCVVGYGFTGKVVTSVHIVTQYAIDFENGPVQEQFRRFSELATKMGAVLYKSKPRLPFKTEPEYKMIRPENGLPSFSMGMIKEKRGYLGILIDFPPEHPLDEFELEFKEKLEFMSALTKAKQSLTPSTTRASAEKSYPKFGEAVIPIGADWRTVVKFIPKTAQIIMYDMDFEEIALPSGARVTSCDRRMTFEDGRLQKIEMDILKKDAEAMLAYLDKDKRDSGSRNLTMSKSVTVKLEWEKKDYGVNITLSRQVPTPNK
jgi:hypothetical protein